MALPVEVIVYAIKTWPNAQEAADQILHYESIRVKAAERKREAETIMTHARTKVAQIMNEKLCLHNVTKRHNDPSGGSDSHETCLICGEIVKQKEARFT